MKHVSRSIFAAGLLAFIAMSPAPAAMVSDGSDGAFMPQTHVDVIPDGDGIYHYSVIDIAAPYMVTVDRQGWDGDVFLLSQGDISIAGILNFEDSNLHLQTAGNIHLSGRIYGSGSLFLGAGGDVSLTNNANGSPDQHYPDGGSVQITADGLWDPDWDPDNLSASAGLVLTSASFSNYVPSLDIVLDHPYVFVEQVPVPGAFWLFASAVGLLGWTRRGQT